MFGVSFCLLMCAWHNSQAQPMSCPGTAEEAECLTCRLGSGLGRGWQPALDSGLDQSMAAETTLIYPKGRPAAPPASLRQSAGSHRPEGMILLGFS